MGQEEFRDAKGRLEFPPDHIGRKRYVTVAGIPYSVPDIYCYMAADRRYYLYGDVPESSSGPMIIKDLEPYRSPLDGSIVTSRSEHRAHMRKHGVIERGNEPFKPFASVEAPRAGYDIVKAMNNGRR